MTTKNLGTLEKGCPESVSQGKQKTTFCAESNTIIAFPQPASGRKYSAVEALEAWERRNPELMTAYERLAAGQARAMAFLQDHPELQMGVPYLMAMSPPHLAEDYLRDRGIMDATIRIHGLEIDLSISQDQARQRLGRGLPKGTLETIWIPYPDAPGNVISWTAARCRR